jgi:hypothetical protein
MTDNIEIKNLLFKIFVACTYVVCDSPTAAAAAAKSKHDWQLVL